MIAQIIILILAIPLGFIVAYLSRDELVQGRAWFRALFIASIMIGLLMYILGFSYISWTCAFIAIVVFISIAKSKDPRWTRLKFR